MRKLSFIAGTAFALCAATPAFAQISTTSSTDAAAMGTALAGPGLTLTGSSLSSDTQNGFFNNGSVIGINQGVVLTTGNLSCAGSANTTSSCSGSGTGSSLLLTFTLASDSLFFNYVFGSEEYNEFVGSSFNDSFQLLLNGPGFTNVNLAQIPGNGGPVTINNVNNGSNAAFFNDNSAGGLPFELDGFTDVLTASATGLTIGASYTLSFNIADVGDSSLDSAVFIQGGTIGTTPTPTGAVPEPSTWAMMLMGFGAIGVGLRRGRRNRNPDLKLA
ncbi:MAG: choice-of-anchor L domain-containing protein [Pseudomonadota bacterium]